MTQCDGQEKSLHPVENAGTKTRRLSNRLKSQSNENVAPVDSDAVSKGDAKDRASLGAMDVVDEEDKRKSTCLKAANDALKKKSLEPAAAKQKRRRSSSSRIAGEDEPVPVPVPPHNADAGHDEPNLAVMMDGIAVLKPHPGLPMSALPPPGESKSKDIQRRRSNSNGKDQTAEAVTSNDCGKENQAPLNGQDTMECDNDRAENGGAVVETASQRSMREQNAEWAGEVIGGAQPSAAEPKQHRIVRPRLMALRTKNADPAQCLDRIDDMYDLYYAKEQQYSAKPYMHFQDDINRKMRAILVDWMVEVHFRFKLQTMTLWLSVNILDRYLMTTRVMRAKLQLVGITAILIACKYEEMQPPEVRECVTITDEAYDKVELLEMEKQILVALDYDIMVPTTYTFLQRYLNAISAAEPTRHLACYYAERNLQEIDSLAYSPHHMAATAIYLANLQQQQRLHHYPGVAYPVLQAWSSTLQLESGFRAVDLKDYARIMIKHVGEETETASKRRLTACKKKFALDRYSSVSKLRLPRP